MEASVTEARAAWMEGRAGGEILRKEQNLLSKFYKEINKAQSTDPRINKSQRSMEVSWGRTMGRGGQGEVGKTFSDLPGTLPIDHN